MTVQFPTRVGTRTGIKPTQPIQFYVHIGSFVHFLHFPRIHVLKTINTFCRYVSGYRNLGLFVPPLGLEPRTSRLRGASSKPIELRRVFAGVERIELPTSVLETDIIHNHLTTPLYTPFPIFERCQCHQGSFVSPLCPKPRKKTRVESLGVEPQISGFSDRRIDHLC